MHVGKRIKSVLDEQGRSASWLASKIPCERTNMYDIFKREDVSVALLYKVSIILGHDFFLEISDELHTQTIDRSPYNFTPPHFQEIDSLSGEPVSPPISKVPFFARKVALYAF